MKTALGSSGIALDRQPQMKMVEGTMQFHASLVTDEANSRRPHLFHSKLLS